MNYYLMHKNTPVIRLNNGEVLNYKLVPAYLKAVKIDKNQLYYWISRRAVPINRENADKLYILEGLPRQGAEIDLMLKTHALSINDNYWIAAENELSQLNWENINLFHNSLSKSVEYLAFTGNKSLTISSEKLSPEFTGQGTFAKCFRRTDDGGLEICKAGKDSEIAAEVMTSYICSILGIPHVDYRYEIVYGARASVSRIYTNEAISWESAFNYTTYTERTFKLNIYNYAFQKYARELWYMILVDGLMLNEDRHLQNWSLDIDGNTNEEIGLAPLYDFNKAMTGNHQSSSHFVEGKNLLSAAKEAQKHLRLDLQNMLIPIAKYMPAQWQEGFINRVMYIYGTKSNQADCYI